MSTLTPSQLYKKIEDTGGVYDFTSGIANLFNSSQYFHPESVKKIARNFTWRISISNYFSFKPRLYFFLEEEFEIFNKTLIFNFQEGLNIIEEPIEIYLFCYNIQINSRLIPIKVLSTKLKETYEV